MLFHTFEFLVFWLTLVALLAAVRRDDVRKAILLAASWLFYAWWHVAFLPLLWLSTAIAYVSGRAIAAATTPAAKRLGLTLSVTANLALLGTFKYANFLSETAIGIARVLGFDADWHPFAMALPIGISFYTFHGLGYAIDVYRGRNTGQHSARDVALYMAFFPQLVAGPIVRASTFFPQVARPMEMRCETEDVFLVLQGLVKKVLVADNVARFVDAVYADVERWPSSIIWLATIAFAIQIYCDFSGYTDIAIGLARMLGFRLPPNFDYPYFARNPADFWRRWHISFSSWIRDYGYVSLPGNEIGPWHRRRNTVLTMLLAGLWHGASWTFVAWGLAHGFLLAAHDLYGDIRRRLNSAYQPSQHRLTRALSVVATQYFILLTMILFRARDFSDMGIALRKFVFFDFDLRLAGLGLRYLELTTSALIVAAFLLVHAIARATGGLDRRLARLPMGAAAVVCVVCGLIGFSFWPSHEPPFIYFRF